MPQSKEAANPGDAQTQSVRYSQAISVGNASNIDVVDCLDYLGDDPDTRAIAIYVEGVKRGREFLETEDASSDVANQVAQRDAFRVFVGDDSGQWELAGSNNSDALAETLRTLLSDRHAWLEFAAAALRHPQEHRSWDVVATEFAHALDAGNLS